MHIFCLTFYLVTWDDLDLYYGHQSTGNDTYRCQWHYPCRFIGFLFALNIEILLVDVTKPEKSKILTLTWPLTSSVTSRSNFWPCTGSSRTYRAIEWRLKFGNQSSSLGDLRGPFAPPPPPAGRVTNQTTAVRGLTVCFFFLLAGTSYFPYLTTYLFLCWNRFGCLILSSTSMHYLKQLLPTLVVSGGQVVFEVTVLQHVSPHLTRSAAQVPGTAASKGLGGSSLFWGFWGFGRGCTVVTSTRITSSTDGTIWNRTHSNAVISTSCVQLNAEPASVSIHISIPWICNGCFKCGQTPYQTKLPMDQIKQHTNSVS